MINNSKILRVNSNTVLTINNKIIEVDTNLNSVILTIPLVTNDTYELNVIDIQGNAATNNIVITVQSPYTINGMASITLNTEYANATITYDGNGNYAATIHDNGGGGGADVTADNGLNFTGGNPNNITLGGALTNNTDIDTLDFRFKVEGTDPGFGFNQGLSINANSNQAILFSTTLGANLGWDSTLNRLQIESGSLDGVTITNDGTNNIILEPTSLDVNHNTLIRLQFNEGASKASTITMDNVESVFNYTNTSTGAISQHSLNDSYWTASYQSANLANIQLDDNWVRTVWQNGATADVSYIIAQNGNVTLENSDGSTTSTVRVDAANGISLVSQTPLFINIPSTPQPVGSVLTLLDNSNGECEWQQLANPTGDSMLIQASDPEILSLNSPNNLIATIGPSSFELPDISTLAVGQTKSFTCYKSVAVGNVAVNCTAGATCEGRFGGLFFSGTGGFVLTSQGQAVTLTAIGGSNIWFVSNSNI